MDVDQKGNKMYPVRQWLKYNSRIRSIVNTKWYYAYHKTQNRMTYPRVTINDIDTVGLTIIILG